MKNRGVPSFFGAITTVGRLNDLGGEHLIDMLVYKLAPLWDSPVRKLLDRARAWVDFNTMRRTLDHP